MELSEETKRDIEDARKEIRGERPYLLKRSKRSLALRIKALIFRKVLILVLFYYAL